MTALSTSTDIHVIPKSPAMPKTFEEFRKHYFADCLDMPPFMDWQQSDLNSADVKQWIAEAEITRRVNERRQLHLAREHRYELLHEWGFITSIEHIDRGTIYTWADGKTELWLKPVESVQKPKKRKLRNTRVGVK